MSMEADHPASPAPGQHAPQTQVTGEDELKDKFCDATSPVTVQFNEVTMAAYKIRGGIERTPCTVSIKTTTYYILVPAMDCQIFYLVTKVLCGNEMIYLIGCFAQIAMVHIY